MCVCVCECECVCVCVCRGVGWRGSGDAEKGAAGRGVWGVRTEPQNTSALFPREFDCHWLQ